MALFGRPHYLNDQLVIQPPLGYTFQPPPPPPPRHGKRLSSQTPQFHQHGQGNSTPSSATGSQGDKICEPHTMHIHHGQSRRGSSVDGSVDCLMVQDHRQTAESLQGCTYHHPCQQDDSLPGEALQRLEAKLMMELARVERDSQSGYQQVMSEVGELKEQNRLLRSNCHALEAQNNQLHQYIIMLRERTGMEAHGPFPMSDNLDAGVWDRAASAVVSTPTHSQMDTTNHMSTATTAHTTRTHAINLPTAAAVAAAVSGVSVTCAGADRRAVPRLPHTHGDIW